MSVLDALIFGVRTLFQGSNEFPQRSRIRFNGATLTDNQAEDVTDIFLGGGAPSGSAGGDLAGSSYPDPIVSSVFSGIDTGAINSAAVEWFPPDALGEGSTARLTSLTTTDDTITPARLVGTNPNAAYGIDAVIIASKAGDGVGVGSLMNMWKASALFTKRSGAAVLVDSHVSTVILGGSNGFGGPGFDVSGTNGRLLVTGLAATTLKWTIKTEITFREA